MRIAKARRDYPCAAEDQEAGTRCCVASKTIKVGEHYCMTTPFTKNKNGLVRSSILRYHWDCWEGLKLRDLNTQRSEYQRAITREEERERKVRDKKTRGRPKKYSDSLLARNLLSLIWYHKKHGNWDKVRGLEEELAGLKVQDPQ